MIAQLSGRVVRAGATEVLVDLGGFGLRALCTPATASAARPGEVQTFATSLVVREDSLTLFAFADDTERDAFELVQTASGVGPKLALALVSVLSPAELVSAISSENLTRLCAVPGIGRKGAQKLVIELKDRVQTLLVDGSGPEPASAATGVPEWREQVSEGLQGLGWSARDAEAACDAVAPLAEADPPPAVGTLMRAALQSLAR